MSYQLIQGDALTEMAKKPDGTYTAVFCDPPYGISFMNRAWDHGVPSSEVWKEAYRICRPGAVLMVFGGTRTWHRLAVNIEDAGWQMFDTIMYVYGSGFPKSMDIGKSIDKAAGAERDTVGIRRTGVQKGSFNNGSIREADKWTPITAPVTESAQQWDGYGTALKPAYEPVLCFRKPLESTYAHSAQTHGTAALNIDGCRVPAKGEQPSGSGQRDSWRHLEGRGDLREWSGNATPTAGRWPANLIHDGSDEVMAVFDLAEASKSVSGGTAPKRSGGIMGKRIDEQRPRTGHDDQGSPARFFYCAKSSTSEREAGTDGNPHPTVKPLALTEYLARLIVPPADYRDSAQILIPFAGVGSEAIGAMRAGWQQITGIELDPDYCAINRQRFDHWQGAQPALSEVA